ncbi:MAG: hypothetical protein HKM26_09775 [Winogradskyella sp.]|nr:hypothetical protein [Winogradskyella sp.]
MKNAFVAIVDGYAFRYGRMYSNADLLANYDKHLETTYSYQESTDGNQFSIKNQYVNSIRIKTGSKTILTTRKEQNQTFEALKSTLEIRSGSIEGVEASTIDGFGVNPPISRPSSSESLNSQTFGAKTSLDNNSSDSDDSEDSTCSSPYFSSEYLDQLLSETLDNVDSLLVRSSNNYQLSEVPEVSLDYEISDSEEIYDEEYNDSDDKQIYLNSMSPGYKSAKNDSYTDSVYQYKYSTSPSCLARFLRREIYANKKEH